MVYYPVFKVHLLIRISSFEAVCFALSLRTCINISCPHSFVNTFSKKIFKYDKYYFFHCVLQDTIAHQQL